MANTSRQLVAYRHNQLVQAHAYLKDALDVIGAVPTKDLHRGNFVEWFMAVAAIQSVERSLALLLQPISPEPKS